MLSQFRKTFRSLTEKGAALAANDEQVWLVECEDELIRYVPATLGDVVQGSVGDVSFTDPLLLMHDVKGDSVAVVPWRHSRADKRCHISVPLGLGFVWQWRVRGQHGVGLCLGVSEGSWPVWVFRCVSARAAEVVCNNAVELGLGAVGGLSRFVESRLWIDKPMSAVFIARDLVAEEEVAVKFLKTRSGSCGDLATLCSDAGSGARGGSRGSTVGQSEWDILRRLNHPNVAAFRGAYFSDGGLSIVTDLVADGNLFDLVEEGGLKVSELASVSSQLLAGLHYIHGLGIMHRDLKPDNILVENNQGSQRLVLADFGYATFDPAQDSQPCCGSPGYVAPEVILRLPYGMQADMFSFGAILYFCAFSQPAFPGSTDVSVLRRTLKCQPVFKTSPVPCLIEDLVQGCLQLHPDARPSAAAGLASLLDGVAPPVCEPANSGLAPRLQLFSEVTLRGRKSAGVSQKDRDPGGGSVGPGYVLAKAVTDTGDGGRRRPARRSSSEMSGPLLPPVPHAQFQRTPWRNRWGRAPHAQTEEPALFSPPMSLCEASTPSTRATSTLEDVAEYGSSTAPRPVRPSGHPRPALNGAIVSIPAESPRRRAQRGMGSGISSDAPTKGSVTPIHAKLPPQLQDMDSSAVLGRQGNVMRSKSDAHGRLGRYRPRRALDAQPPLDLTGVGPPEPSPTSARRRRYMASRSSVDHSIPSVQGSLFKRTQPT